MPNDKNQLSRSHAQLLTERADLAVTAMKQTRRFVDARSALAALLQRSLRVEASRRPGVVVLRLVPAAVGHAGESLASSLTLGSAIAISGAAVNPNMGYHSSPAVTFLLTLFDARAMW